MQQVRDYLIEQYLDYRNNYLSIENYAEHNGLRRREAENFILLAAAVFNTNHPEE